jgi:FSR family fosmidomycin resistance protein-like MFS transporter
MANPAAGIVTGTGRASAPGWNLRGLSVIAFAHGLSDFYSGVVPFVIFLVLTRDHVSAAYQGALVLLWYVTSSIVQPLFGRYSDRHGQWWFLPAAIALTVTAISLAGHAPTIALLAACIVIGGFGSAIMHPEAGKYSAMLSGSRKAGGISIFQIGGQIGYSVGPAIVALLYARYGTNGTLFLLAPGLLAVAWLFGVMRAVDRTAGRIHRAHSERAGAAAGPVDRIGVSLLIASTALRYFATAAFMTYLPNFLVGHGSSIPFAGQVVTAFLLVSSFGLLAGGALADRFGAVRISVLALAGAVPFLFAFFALPGPFGVLALLCGSVLLTVQNAPGVALVQAMLPKNLGMALGLMNGVAFGIGSALVAGVGVAVAALGAGPALEGVSAVPLLAALACGLVGPRLPAHVRSEAVGQ